MSETYEKLSMAGKQVGVGAFVKTLDSGENGVGFADGWNVHSHWLKTGTISYDQGLEAIQKAVDEREDIKVPAKSIKAEVTEDNRLVFNLDGRQFNPDAWALNSFSARSDMKNYSSTFLEKLMDKEEFDRQDAETMAVVINNVVRRLDPEKKFFVRTYKNGTMRAFLTEKYSPIDNRFYVEALREILPEGRLSHWRGDADTIFGNIIIPNTIMEYPEDDTDFGGMISIGNCELGKRTLSQYPSLFRSICMNGCIWGQEVGKRIKRRHVGNIDLTALREDIRQNIEYQLPLLPEGIRKLIDLQSYKLEKTSMKQIISTVVLENKMAKSEATEVLKQWVKNESHHKSLYGVVNAITRAGQTFDNKSWVKFDELAGNYLSMDGAKWSNFNKRASQLNDEVMAELYIVA